MHRFWQHIIRPVCEALRPATIVEVGSSGGFNTAHVLEYCKAHGARCHVIDPVPPGNLAQIRGLLDDVGTYHQDTSLNALPLLAADLYLIDGDHNWYTVFHELKAIEASHARAARGLPVLFLHDVHWPYGRRDLYYAPERIPAEYRQPHARRGIALGRADLLPEGGYNYKHLNALKEGGPRNGVLTAIEDFVRESTAEWRLRKLPSFHGLAVLYAPAHLSPAVVAELDRLTALPVHVLAHLEAVEEYRVLLLTELVDTYRQLGGRPGPRLAKLVRTAKRLAGRAE